MAKAYLLSVVVVDSMGEHEDGAALIQEFTVARFANHCVHLSEHQLRVEQVVDLGEWRDGHPLNYRTTDAIEWMKAREGEGVEG